MNREFLSLNNISGGSSHGLDTFWMSSAPIQTKSLIADFFDFRPKRALLSLSESHHSGGFS